MELYLGSGQHLGLFRNFGHFVLPFDSHEVNAVNPFHFFEFLDLFTGHFNAFGSRFTFLDSLETVDDLFGHIGQVGNDPKDAVTGRGR